jgi:subtilisin-like proprotein convertase family protein
MSYAGLCGNQNIAGSSDTYFHAQSLEEIAMYSREGTGNTCATRISIENTEPLIDLDYTDGFFIPISTPFQLQGSASDAEDEDLTYCWEQYDVGPLSGLGDPSGNTPLFRSLPPGESPTRIFPRIEDIVTNVSSRNEQLPDYARDMTFRLTVRDNHEGGGAAVWEEMSFQTTEAAGPFTVTSPATDRPEWEAGTYQEVRWDVANTDQEPVNCQYVNILLSTDGGYTYNHVLATGLPNTGSAMVPVPNIETIAARIKVEANDNIFFNISSQNFRINAPNSAGFTMSPSQNSQDVCLPDLVSINLETQGFLGFEEDIRFELMEGLPSDAVYDFSPLTVKPGGTSTLRIEIPDRNNSGLYEVKLRALVDGMDTVVQTLYLNLTSSDFSEITTLEPMNGENGIGLTTTLAWTGSLNASRYEVELADNPRFEAPYLLDAVVLDNQTTEFAPDVILEENTLHYWRIRAVNECGEGQYLPVNTFHTENLICTGFSSDDTPVVIPGSGLPTKESVISVDFDGIISDLNIPLIKGNYQPVSSLRISLISPSEKEVVLFDGNCGNTTDLLIGFDDEAPDTLRCPPDDGIVFQPLNPLSAFIGESTQGNWTLKVQVIESGFGGVGNLGEWQLEFCASSSPVDPIVVTNDTLFVPPGLANPVMPEVLEVQDEDNSADELIYTLVQVPEAGTLYFLGEALVVGDTFRQASINAFNLYYANEDPDVVLDSFIFVVEDGTGGWIPPQTFTIRVDDKATVDTDEPELLPADILLFPNPARSAFRLQFPAPLEQSAQLSLFDARGSLVQQMLMPAGEREEQVDVSQLPKGLYFVRLQFKAQVVTRRLIVQ